MKYVPRSLASAALPLIVSAAAAQAPARDYWQHLDGAIDALAVSPTDPDRLYFASDDGLVGASRDGGATWRWSGLRQNTPNDPVTSLAALGGDTVLASCLRDERDVFYRSTDGGATWTRVRYDNPAAQDTRLAYVAPGVTLLGDTYVSRDGLVTRDSLAHPGRKTPDGQGGILAVELVGSFGLGTAASTYYSADAGRTWDTVATAAPWGDRINFSSGYSVAVRGRDRYAIRFQGRRDIVVTTDGGRTFATADPGVSQVGSLFWASETDLVAAGTVGVAVSIDGGATWRDADTYFTGAAGGPGLGTADGAGGLLLAYGAAVYRAPAGGGPVTALRRVPGSLAQFPEVVCVDSSLSYAYGGGELYRSRDAGATWSLIEGDPATYRPLVGSPAGAWAVRTTDRDLYRSTDGGDTWTLAFDLPTSGVNPVQAMFRAGESGLVVQLSSGTFVSYDDGATWTQRDAAGVRASDGIDYAGAADAGTWVYQFGQGNSLVYYVTRDSGATFTSPGTFGNQQRGAGAAAAEGRLFATRSFFSDDGFATTQSFADSTGFEDVNLRDVWFRNRRHGAYHDGDGQRGYTTFDGGRTWQRDDAMVPRAIDFRDTSTAIALDPVRGLFRFADGAPWREERLRTPGTSAVSASASAKTVRAFPNPVRAGGTVCFTGVNLRFGESLPQTGRDAGAPNVTVYALDGRRVGEAQAGAGCVRLPAALPEGVYHLRIGRAGVARVVVW